MKPTGTNTAVRMSAIAIDRPGHLLHRLDRRFLRLHAVLDVVHHRLDDDDRVVDDDADGEHEAQQREHVDREAEQREEHERADERHRHGQQRNQRRAPVLQEDEHDDDHEHHRLERACGRSR